MEKSNYAVGKREKEFQPYKTELPHQPVTGQDLDQFRQKYLLQ